MTFSEIGETYKSAGVVVTDSLGVPKGLQQWVGLQDNVLDVLSQQTDQRLGRGKRLPQWRKAKLSLRIQFWTREGEKASNLCPWDFWKIYSFLSTGLNLFVYSCLPSPLT